MNVMDHSEDRAVRTGLQPAVKSGQETQKRARNKLNDGHDGCLWRLRQRQRQQRHVLVESYQSLVNRS